MAAKKKSGSAPFVIVRCSAAGVHAGELVSHMGSTVALKDSRRLWEWRVPMGKGAFLSGVALHGLGENCKVGETLPSITLMDACELIPCSAEARASIAGYAPHVRSR